MPSEIQLAVRINNWNDKELGGVIHDKPIYKLCNRILQLNILFLIGISLTITLQYIYKNIANMNYHINGLNFECLKKACPKFMD